MEPKGLDLLALAQGDARDGGSRGLLLLLRRLLLGQEGTGGPGGHAWPRRTGPRVGS